MKPPRESATVMLLRDGARGLEVFMVRRHLNSDFVGGAYVFPGGSLDEADCALTRYAGIAPAEAARRLELPAERALGHFGAAIRETFEEAGVLLARRHGAVPSLDDEEHWEARRKALLDGTLAWADMLAAEELELACDLVGYFSHWITPEGTPKRFTTRFFVAAMPAGQTPLADEKEVEAGVWVRPADALADKTMTMIFPTIRTLEELATFQTAADALAACQDRQVVANLPRIIERDGEPVVLLPGDPGYDEAAGGEPVKFDPSKVRGA
jgi:8-oxo-dGTP pyrophosphatase MutT (NUDIX family)